MRFYLALWAAKICAVLIRLIAKNRGTNLPGELALRLDPRFVTHLKGVDPAKAVFVTGTNGKSTTTNMIHHILSHSGCAVSANLKGANLLSGVATTLIADCTLGGRFKKEYVVMETDERFLAAIRAQLPAKYLCVTNIQRDQCQRNGEPSYIVGRIAKAIGPDAVAFLNADEPNTLSLGDLAGRTVTYAAAPNGRSFDKQDDFFAVGMPCPKCHDPLRFDCLNIDNIGPFRCPTCGFGTPETPDHLAEDVDFENKRLTVRGRTYAMNFNTPYFVYSYVAAIAVASELGLSAEQIAAALEAFTDIRGRIETRAIEGRELRYIKMKQENQALKSDLEKADDEEFIKNKAREELNMVEAGERIFIDVND